MIYTDEAEQRAVDDDEVIEGNTDDGDDFDFEEEFDLYEDLI